MIVMAIVTVTVTVTRTVPCSAFERVRALSVMGWQHRR